MANPLLLSDVIQIRTFCSAGPQNGINVFSYQVTGVVGGGVTDQDVANALSTRVAPLFTDYFTPAVFYNGLRAQVIRPGLKPFVTSTNGAGTGLIVSDILPPQTALLLSLRTNVAGPRGRGRIYLPFWNEGQSDVNGIPTAGALAFATAWSNGMMAVITVLVGANTVTLTPVVVSRTPPETQIAVSSVVIRTRWATQRRRSLINRADVLGP